MVIVTDPSQISRITNPAIRELVSLRLQQLSPVAATPSTASSAEFPEYPPIDCRFIVVEGGEAVSEIDEVVEFRVLESLFEGLPFGHPDYTPPFEIMEEHLYGTMPPATTRIYELVFIGTDDGAATAIFVPDTEEVDPDLLAMCRAFATPVETASAKAPASAVSTS